MQLSGTSMAAGVVSGAVALVLDARGSLSPQDVKAALQLTSTFLPSAGVVGGGAGTINAVAAVELADTGRISASTTIASEPIVASRMFVTQLPSVRLAALGTSSVQSPKATRIGSYRSRTSDTSDDNASVWAIWR